MESDVQSFVRTLEAVLLLLCGVGTLVRSLLAPGRFGGLALSAVILMGAAAHLRNSGTALAIAADVFIDAMFFGAVALLGYALIEWLGSLGGEPAVSERTASSDWPSG
jgi:hypothetical protein